MVMFLVCVAPSPGHCDYAIHLKNGGRLLTPHYWEQGQEIMFYTTVGVMGIEKQSVRNIKQTDEVLSPSSSIPEPAPDVEAGEAPEEEKAEETAVEEELDIEAYQQAKTETHEEEKSKIDISPYKERKLLLEAELKNALERVREADINNDARAKEVARAKAKEISTKMYNLTAELMEKNNGKMPDEWWE